MHLGFIIYKVAHDLEDELLILLLCSTMDEWVRRLMHFLLQRNSNFLLSVKLLMKMPYREVLSWLIHYVNESLTDWIKIGGGIILALGFCLGSYTIYKGKGNYALIQCIQCMWYICGSMHSIYSHFCLLNAFTYESLDDYIGYERNVQCYPECTSFVSSEPYVLAKHVQPIQKTLCSWKHNLVMFP